MIFTLYLKTILSWKLLNLGCKVDKNTIFKALGDCGCTESDSKENFGLKSCHLTNPKDKDPYGYGTSTDKPYCKESASSQCRNAVAELATKYRNAENAKEETCYIRDPGYNGTQEVDAYCKGD